MQGVITYDRDDSERSWTIMEIMDNHGHHGLPEGCDRGKMADPKYADLPGIVRHFDK